MNNWKYSTIQQIAIPNSLVDGPFGSNLKSSEYTAEGVRLIQLQNIGTGFWINNNQKYISQAKYYQLIRHGAKPGDLAIAKMAEPVARCCLLPETCPLYVIVADCIKMTVKEHFNKSFVRHAINSRVFRAKAEARSTGTTRSRINLSQLKTLSIYHPPLTQQIVIAKILDTIDNVIEKTQALIQKLQCIKKGMLEDLLTQGVDGEGKLRPPYEEAPHFYKETSLGWLPKSWSVSTVKEITTVIRGASPRPKGDPRYYGGAVPRLMVEDVSRDGKYVTPSVDFLTKEGANLSRPMVKGSLVMVCSGVVGVPSILAMDCCIHDGFLGFQELSSKCSEHYLYYLFLRLKDYLDRSVTRGGVFKNLTTAILKELKIALPHVSEQDEIVKIFSNQEGNIEARKKMLSKLQDLKQGLMEDLLTGRVQVPEGLL